MTEKKKVLEKNYEWKSKIEVVSWIKLDGKETQAVINDDVAQKAGKINV